MEEWLGWYSDKYPIYIPTVTTILILGTKLLKSLLTGPDKQQQWEFNKLLEDEIRKKR